MRRVVHKCGAAVVLWLGVYRVLAPAVTAEDGVMPADLRRRVDAGLGGGAVFLLQRQEKDGSWLHHPAVTALSATALHLLPSAPDADRVRRAVDAALDFVVRFRRPDGSIWNRESKEYPNYSTSICLMALAVINRPQDRDAIRRARDFLLDSQFSDVSPDDPAYGGIGYGKKLRPDLSNTQWALEALYITDHLDREPFSKDPARARKADLAWERALRFLSRCQNLRETNDQPWVADDPDNRGGFVYMPGESKAGTVRVNGRTCLRSYGSMTYAGLKSMIYARVKRDDPRVKAAVEWVRRHYTFEENPGLGKAGWFYYLHTAAKALAALGEDVIVDADGRSHDWRRELAGTLLRLQRSDGSWVNDNGRWWESIPELTTAYSMLALEAVLGRGPYGGNAAAVNKGGRGR